MTRSKTTFSLLGAAALAISLTACGGDDGDGGGSSGANYCDEVKTFSEDMSAAMSSTDTDAKADFAESYQKIADVAPSEIKADYQTVADAMTTLAEIDLTDPESASALEEIGDLEAVTTRIGEHIESECS